MADRRQEAVCDETHAPEYTKIDMRTWPRREHFKYYQHQIPCSLSATVQMDVTELLAFAHAHKKRFTACLLYAVCRTVNELDCMKMTLAADQSPAIWQVSHPNFTIFHDDDQTFSDVWMEYRPDFDDFYQDYCAVLRRYGGCRGIKARPGQPANFFCFSSVPWLDFTATANCPAGSGQPPLFPIITCGRYKKTEGRYRLPLTLSISHAAADGYHISVFFKVLQERLDAFRKRTGSC